MTAGRRLRALALTAGVLGACDAGDDAAERTRARVVPAAESATVAAPNAGCAIATEPEVEDALGFDVVMNDNATGNCVITPADGSPAAPALDIRREHRTSAYDYFAAQPDASSVPGLGDRAVWATLNEMTGTIVVVTGDSALTIAIARADGLDPRARRQAEALARLIIRRR